MKLRLKITTPAGDAMTFEHPGPTVIVGREPGCELRLQGAASAHVSRVHARIDLTGAGAVLDDLGSSNGTLHNDSLVDGPRRLLVGDRIQLGYTGTRLTVVDLDLSQPAAITNPKPSIDVPQTTVAKRPAQAGGDSRATVPVGGSPAIGARRFRLSRRWTKAAACLLGAMVVVALAYVWFSDALEPDPAPVGPSLRTLRPEELPASLRRDGGAAQVKSAKH